MAELPVAAHWIGGEWVRSGTEGDSIDPATGAVIGRRFVAGRDEAEQAIAAAAEAFEQTPWRNDRDLRARVLNRIADALEARTDDLVAILGLENGKVAAHARSRSASFHDSLRFNAALALTEFGRAARGAPGRFPLVCGSRRGGGDHRPLELAGGAVHPLARPGAGGGLHGGGDAAGPDRADERVDRARSSPR